MTNVPSVREARATDVDAITALHVAGWQWGYRGQLPDAALDAIDPESRRALWKQVLAGGFPDSDVWIAEVDGRALGFISVGPSRDEDARADEGEVYALYVAREAAGTSVGHVLLQRALDGLKERGAGAVVLWVLESNARARRFYERAGFRADGGAKTAPWQGVELREVRMRRVG
jgi:GNAT superfamily N-acetyltransferase